MNRLLNASLLTCLAPVVAGCCLFVDGLPCGGDSEGVSVEVDLEFKSLDGDRLPLELAVDGDSRDVKRKDRARYRPARGASGEQPKRYKMTARRDGASASESFVQRQQGDCAAWVRVSMHKLRGLEDGLSSAFLSRQSDASGPTFRVEAVWNAAINGLTARVRQDGRLVGDQVDFPGQPAVFLHLASVGSRLMLSAAEPSSGDYDGFGAPSLLQTAVGSDQEIYRLGFGVDGLSKQGTFYFSNFTVRINSAPGAGDEKLVAIPVALALQNCFSVQRHLEYPGLQDLEYLRSLVVSARYYIEDQAGRTLDDAMAGDGLESTTNVAAIRKSFQTAARQLNSVDEQLAHLIQGGATHGKPALKKLVGATRTVEVALGQLFGYQRKSFRTLKRTVNLQFN